MLEVFNNIVPMFLAAVFTYTATTFAGMGIKKKGDRKIAIVASLVILMISFTIWYPSFNGLYDVLGLLGKEKQVAMTISIISVLVGTVIATIFNVKHTEI